MTGRYICTCMTNIVIVVDLAFKTRQKRELDAADGRTDPTASNSVISFFMRCVQFANTVEVHVQKIIPMDTVDISLNPLVFQFATESHH